MRTPIALLLTALTLASCAPRPDGTAALRSTTMVAQEAMPTPAPDQADPAPAPLEPGQRKVIRTATLEIEVERLEATRLLLDSLIRSHQGWITQESVFEEPRRVVASLTIRLPHQHLDSLVRGIGRLALRSHSLTVYSADVTEEYIDTESRLRNLRQVEATFLRLLRRADSIDELLRIETQLAELRATIESIEGRLKYLSHQAAYSTIHLSMWQRKEFRYIPEAADRFGQRVRQSLHQGWMGIVAVLLFLVRLWPLAALALAGWLGYRWVVRRRRARKQVGKLLRKAKKGKKGAGLEAEPDDPSR